MPGPRAELEEQVEELCVEQAALVTGAPEDPTVVLIVRTKVVIDGPEERLDLVADEVGIGVDIEEVADAGERDLDVTGAVAGREEEELRNGEGVRGLDLGREPKGVPVGGDEPLAVPDGGPEWRGKGCLRGWSPTGPGRQEGAWGGSGAEKKGA